MNHLPRPLLLVGGALVAGATIKVALSGVALEKAGFLGGLDMLLGNVTANGTMVILITDGSTDMSAVVDGALVPILECCYYNGGLALTNADNGTVALIRTFLEKSTPFSARYTKYLFIKSLTTLAVSAVSVKLGVAVEVQ